GRRRSSGLAAPRAGRFPVVAAGILGFLSVGGALAVALIPTSTVPRSAQIEPDDLLVPLDVFSASGHASRSGVKLSWQRQPSHGAGTTYAVFRVPWNGVTDCLRSPGTSGTCTYVAQTVGSAGTATSFVDHPSSGTWVYRIALSATPVGPQTST